MSHHLSFNLKCIIIRINQDKSNVQTDCKDLLACGNCWGHQEWDHTIFTTSIQPNEENNGFILNFVKRYLK